MSNTRASAAKKAATRATAVDVDLDAARKQRAEATDAKPVVIKFGGKRFTLPATAEDFGIDLVDIFQGTGDVLDVKAALEMMMGDKQWADFQALKPTIGDLKHLFGDLTKRYNLGE